MVEDLAAIFENPQHSHWNKQRGIGVGGSNDLSGAMHAHADMSGQTVDDSTRRLTEAAQSIPTGVRDLGVL